MRHPRRRPVRFAARRAALQARLFPSGIPRLWCPPLTHYTADGAIDRERQTTHLRFIGRWAGAVLVPGSTGDGWELTDDETREVTDLALAVAHDLGLGVLAGALDPDASRAASRIAETRRRLTEPQARTLCGFAACPPRGRDLSQDQIGGALADLLSLGEPLALYQLPQVTENVMSPELVADLARRFPEFVWFKDTSGDDAVATAAVDPDGMHDLGGVFLVRGAEGGYARALRTEGGAYDGLLLSTANSFGRELAAIIEWSSAGRHAEAQRLSARLESLASEVFALVASLPDGNAFANAGKAVDHFYAHGPDAPRAPAPRLHAGNPLPREVLAATQDALARHDLLPEHGYLD